MKKQSEEKQSVDAGVLAPKWSPIKYRVHARHVPSQSPVRGPEYNTPQEALSWMERLASVEPGKGGGSYQFVRVVAEREWLIDVSSD